MQADHIGIPKLRDMASKSERLRVDFRLTDLPRVAGLLYPDFEASGQQIRLIFDFRRGPRVPPENNGVTLGC